MSTFYNVYNHRPILSYLFFETANTSNRISTLKQIHHPMGLRDDADIGQMAQGDALELKEACGCRCGAAAVGRDGLKDEERRGCDVGDEVRRTLHILCACLCRDDNLDVDIFRVRNLKKARVRIPNGRGQNIGKFQIHADV